MENLGGLEPKIPAHVEQKHRKLEAILAPLLNDGLIVAFSGGVDSAFLLWAAEGARRKHGGRLLALTAVSDSMARTEREDAQAIARELGVEHLWEKSSELEDPRYSANDSNRCYHCKSELFRIGHDVAASRGLKWLAYGYNASDIGDVRPGHKAAQENGILSPLFEAGLEKDDIRILMRAYRIPLAAKPASPCLSSRLMTGVQVTSAKLKDVEELEAILRQGGLGIFRVRLHEQGADRFLRIEIATEEMPKALELREALVSEARNRGYRWVTLDLAGYRMGGGTAR